MNYDIDLGIVQVNDWYYATAFQIESLTTQSLQHAAPGPPGDNVLINGKNKNIVNSGGSYSSFTFTPGKKHLLRLVNIGVDNHLRVSIDGHNMTVITSDLVPVKPFTVNSVLLGVGQRYEVIVEANQAAGNYWLRAEAEAACRVGNKNKGKAIIHYSNVPVGEPTTNTTAISNGCNEPGALVPWVPNNVGNATTFQQQASSLGVNIDLPGK